MHTHACLEDHQSNCDAHFVVCTGQLFNIQILHTDSPPLVRRARDTLCRWVLGDYGADEDHANTYGSGKSPIPKVRGDLNEKCFRVNRTWLGDSGIEG